MGEDKAFDYLKQMHQNVNAYARSGTGPVKAVARGETAVSLSFVHDAVTEKNAGFPVAYNTPCEGTGYEIGSMSIIKGARNLKQAAGASTEGAQHPTPKAPVRCRQATPDAVQQGHTASARRAGSHQDEAGRL